MFQRGGIQDEVLQHMQSEQMLWTGENEHEASLVHLPREEEVLEAGHVHQDMQVSQDEGLPVHVNTINPGNIEAKVELGRYKNCTDQLFIMMPTNRYYSV